MRHESTGHKGPLPQVGALLCVVAAWGAAVAPQPAFAAANYMGIGLIPPSDYCPLRLFADEVKCARAFSVADFSGNPVAVDAQGWPLDDAGLMLWAGASNMQGTYRLSFTTQNASVDARTVALSFAGASMTPANMTYDMANNRVSYDLAVPDVGALRVFFRNSSGGVKRIKCMRPTVVGGSTPYDTSVTFTTQAKNALSKFQVLRFMHVVNSLSSNMVAEWSERTKPDYAQQVGVHEVGGGDAGTAWEYTTQLCNEVDADLYANIPFLSTDAYLDSLANLIKRTLEPERKIYLEYSNELWNGVGSYDAHRNIDSANAEVARGGSPLNFDSTTNTYYWAWRRAGKRGKEISDIFRRVFGDSAMMTRVRPLLMTQTGNAQATLSQNMTMMFDYYGNATKVADPHPPNYYFYGAGGAAYYDFGSDATTVDQVWSSNTMDTSAFIAGLIPDIAWCATFGLKRVAYEGGFCYEGSDTATLNAAWHDDRLTRSTIEHHEVWSRYGGDLLVYFSMTGWNPADVRAGFINNVDSLGTPKLKAIDSLNARSAQAVTYGSVPPCSIDGDSAAARFTPLWDPPSNCRPTEWYSYVIRVEQAGTYGVTVDYAAEDAGALALFGDGTHIGTPALTSGTHTTAKSTLYLEPGLHGFIVRVTSLASGRMSINQVNVSVESLAADRARVIKPARALRIRAEMAGDLLHVALSGATEGIVPVVLCTMQGRTVRAGTIAVSAEGRAMASLRVRGLGDGLYIVRVGRTTATVVRRS